MTNKTMKNRFKFRAWDHTNWHIADFNRYGKPGDFWMMALSHGWDIMQCTGLKDKNGKLIYEGDIVYLAGQGLCEIEFPFENLYQAYPEGDIGRIKGNIYENPELKEIK
mgnify:FL=1